ncbi:hypothetical protein TWF281_009771 [Arthrobotrys megalospora]
MDCGQRIRSVNMTLVGFALKKQQEGQPFSSAAAETLRRLFPDMPPEVLVERVGQLQETRDRLVVNKYGDLVTMKSSCTGSSKASTSSGSTNETVVADGALNGADVPEWSPSRPSPQRRNKHAPIHIPDLESLVITDSDGDEPVVVHNPRRRTKLPTRAPADKTQPEIHNREPRGPNANTTARNTLSSPSKTAKEPQTPQKESPKKIPVNAAQGNPDSGGPGTGNGPRPRSLLKSTECSPIKRVLNNKASRLRTQSNIKKITSFETPKHGRLNFEKGSPVKDPSSPLIRSNLAEEAATSFAAIDNFFQKTTNRSKSIQHLDESKERSRNNTPNPSPLKISRKPPLNRYFTTESEILGAGPSSLVFQMDEDMQFQGPPQYVENEANDSASVNGNQIQINVQVGTTTGSITSQPPSEVPELYHDNKNPTHLTLSDLGNSKSSTIRRISLRGTGMENQEPVSTQLEVIEPTNPLEPTTLNVRVGSVGLVINVHCAGELIIGGTAIN